MKFIFPSNAKRIYIIGGPGVGKTTFGKNLSEVLNIPLYRGDSIAHSPDFQKIYSKKEQKNKLSKIIKKRTWILEGFYYEDNRMKEALKKADLVILLKLSKPTNLIRVYKRSKSLIKITSKHTYKDMLYLLKKTYKHKNKPLLKIIKYHNQCYLILNNKKQIQKFMKTIIPK